MDFSCHSEDSSLFHGLAEAGTLVALPADARVDHLRYVSLFSDCTEEELRRFADISTIVDASAGTALTKAGAAGDSFFLIVDGRVSVETQVGPGDPLHPGDFFGEMSLIDGEPRSATIRAITDVRLLVVHRVHFWRLLEKTPDLVRRILVVLSGRVRRLEQAANGLRQRMNQT
jgi:CRP/FNR family transcriptional regulator, cyclic AMP receptor protein